MNLCKRLTGGLAVAAVLAAACNQPGRDGSRGGGHVHGGPPAAPTAAAAAQDVAYYTCPMHSAVRSREPGICPICSMPLQPVTRQEAETGVVLIDAVRRQTIGVTTARVERQPLVLPIRAVGRVVYDQRRLADITVKLRGWIGKVYADVPGRRVRRGEALFAFYSPELYAAQRELQAAVASRRAARSTSAPGRADYLVDAARRRLELWGLQPAQVEQIGREARPLEYVPILSPVSGYIVEKNVVPGTAVEAGTRLYRIADLDEVWIEAQVYESDLPLVESGDSARVTLPYLPGWQSEARVSLVYPYLDDATRTGRVRLDLPNVGLELKPDMYADVEIDKHLGERLAVPSNAVLYAGRRSFVFVDLGEGRLKPRSVVTGRVAGDLVEILSGLEEGDVIVTSGTFLVAAESRLKVDMEHWQ